MKNNEKKEEILNRLSEIEKEKSVQIFLACESGSRAWGFESQNSDYDVRFLYLHKKDWYLTIDEARDVIEHPIDKVFDISGWDIRKALKLFRKSNPPLLEWLDSPIIYMEKYSIAKQLRELRKKYFSPIACLYHYLHMAQGNFREYLKGDTVLVKKYFYILRPILACQWIEADLGPVPMKFQTMVDKLIDSDALKKAIYKLIEQKKQGNELSWGSKVSIISNFIESEIDRLEKKEFHKKGEKLKIETLDNLFRSALKEAWEV